MRQVLSYIRENNGIDELLKYIFDDDTDVAYRALWICNHLTDAEINSLPESVIIGLIDMVINCEHDGMRRLMLNIIYRWPVCRIRQVELLDFCLERAMLRTEPAGVRSVCLKLAYKLTDGISELQNELYYVLDLLNDSDLPPSLSCVRRNILRLSKL